MNEGGKRRGHSHFCFRASGHGAGRWDSGVRGGRARRLYPVGKLASERVSPTPSRRRGAWQRGLRPAALGKPHLRRGRPAPAGDSTLSAREGRGGAQAKSRGLAARPPLCAAASRRFLTRRATTTASGSDDSDAGSQGGSCGNR